jgi:nicotinamide-nucleotide amidase
MNQVTDIALPVAVGQKLLEKNWTIGTMESCTGGLIVTLLTDIGGSSQYVVGSIVSYATRIKEQFGVSSRIIERESVISSPVAFEMAKSVRLALQVDVGISVTGVAGPTQQDGHDAGEVHIAVITPTKELVRQFSFIATTRDLVRKQAAYAALRMLYDIL